MPEAKAMSTDTTFITNEGEKNLRERFRVLIKDTRLFDALVGYFYTSGFYALYKSLENTEKIRILIGISTGRQTVEMMREAETDGQGTLDFSHVESKERFSEDVAKEMEASEDSAKVEEGVRKFVEWLRNGKMEIKAYPSGNIHAKLYIMTFVEGDKDVGRVITGSSNFTQAGLVDNLEFNVELKDRPEYEFALAKFNELWADAVDVKEEYIETVEKRTWLNNTITPYELYLKFLYEYFREKINIDQEKIENRYLPEGFLDLEYQAEAVKDAKNKLEEYGGVFISDVVGLGKTYISAMLASQLAGRTLVIAPPGLLYKDSPGSWPNVFSDFKVAADFESMGRLDDLVSKGTDRYKNIFIDEAHRFRTEMNVTYEMLAQICRGKRVILVTATPLNNYPSDILSQLKLFQKSRKSTIPNMANLEQFFGNLDKKLKGLDRQKDYDKYIAVARDNAREIRDKVLKYVMVRRTRGEIVRYFAKDLAEQKLRFPDVADPEAVLYQLNENEDRVFTRTVELVTQRFQYARYTPMLYYEGKITQAEDLAQKNMRKFMKILLVKRLESSFYAFRKSLGRFMGSYERFLEEFGRGNVYVSKRNSDKLFDLLDNDDDEGIQRLIDEDKAARYDAAEFKPSFRADLAGDLAVLKDIDALWKTVTRDPKLDTFVERLKTAKTLKANKLIVFTESEETAHYLKGRLDKELPGQTLGYSGKSGAAERDKVIANFDARARTPRDDYRILVSTEVLAEGVNLHRSNVVINYDIPWNPTRLMQRAGRINRVDTKFDTIYTFNFFPTVQSNDQIKLEEAAKYKIQAFIEMLGLDARLLTDGEEIKSHDLFNRLTSKKAITGEDGEEESELKYLQVIRSIRDNEPELFARIKRLPKKARTGRGYAVGAEHAAPLLLTYFRKGKLQKFFCTQGDLTPGPFPAREGVGGVEGGERRGAGGATSPPAPSPLTERGHEDRAIRELPLQGVATEELDFMSAAKWLEARENTKRENIGTDYYELLETNKEAFRSATADEAPPFDKLRVAKGGRDSAVWLLKVLRSKEVRHCKGYTEDDEEYVRKLTRVVDEGGLPKQTAKTVAKELKTEANPLKILGILKANIAPEFFKETMAEGAAQTAGPREVILSEYFVSP